MSKRIPKLKYKFVDASDIGKLAVKARIAEKLFVGQASELIKREVKSVLEENDKIATRKLYNAIRRRSRETAEGYVGVVYIDKTVTYGGKVIEGTAPYSRKISPNTIKKWIVRKQARGKFTDVNDDKQLTNLSKMIANKIYSRGIPAFNFLKIAYDRVESDVKALAKSIVRKAFGGK